MIRKQGLIQLLLLLNAGKILFAGMGICESTEFDWLA
jgi:hypothetical protein